MLDLMHDGDPYGHLTAGGVPIDVEQLARIVGIGVKRTQCLLDELEQRKVFSRTPAGVICSRRMVRDEHIRDVRRRAGKLGGNPNLVKHPPCDLDKGLVKQTDNQNPTPAVAVGSLQSAEQHPPSSTAGDVLRGPQTERLLKLVPDRDAWAHAIIRSGASPSQVERAATQFLGNGAAKTPKLGLFEGYLRNVGSPKNAKPPRHSGAAGSGGASASELGKRFT
jgi:hypothetical protein